MNSTESDQLVLRSFEVTSNAGLMVALTPGFPIVRVNAALENLLGRDREYLLGRPCLEALGVERSDANVDIGVVGDAIVQCAGDQDRRFWCRLEVRPMPGVDGAVAYSYCTLHDVTEFVRLRNNRDYLGTHDPLTGLVRAYMFEEQLANELAHAVQACSRVIVCCMSIDRIGLINELCNYQVGDQLLHLIAERLSRVAGHADNLCHIGSNKFMAAFADPAGDTDQVQFGQRLAAVLEQPFAVAGLSLRMTASVGVACFPDTGSEVTELLQQAAAAARQAARGGGNEVRVFVPAQREILHTRLRLGARLRGAVERGELELHYQPIVGIAKHDVVGMEALVRWRNPELGLVMPDQFIPLAEDLGMIGDIGRWVLNEGCLQARRWLDQGVGEFTLAVNVAGVQMRGEQLLEEVGQALNAARLPARFLALELTETAILTNVEQAIGLMREIYQLGVKWSLDDFGTGHSSLSYLQRLPVSRLKIDQSFVRAMPNDAGATRICRAVLGLAHEFGFSVVAEGVEQAVQLAFLERNGCEMAQGFFFSRPITADAMLALLREPRLRMAAAPDAAAASTGTILLVDDEKNVLSALSRVLRRDGYRVLTAGTFNDAFAALAAEDVQVVISDHRMPDGKGTDFLGKVKVSHPETVRMILSGYADLATVTDAINVGAVHRFMTKPWNDDELRAAVRDALRLARTQGAGTA